MQQLITYIPMLPLCGSLLILLFGNRFHKDISGYIASAAIGVSFVLTLISFVMSNGFDAPVVVDLYRWVDTGTTQISISLTADKLSSVFMLVITGIGLLIHVYSIGYMHEDKAYPAYFAYLNLFVFFMLILVMASNFILLFVGWEGVGLCSYLLIGFWHQEHQNNDAAKKAFIMNRIGDLGFLLGMFVLFNQYGTLNFSELQAAVLANPEIAGLTLATLLIFIGATGKSAQIPLFTWLPDAMAGPTPVSALIHAATMVTSGIYIIARTQALFLLTPITMNVILAVGLATALLGALAAVYQNDIKKILAYSTVSQLGLMFAAMGSGAITSGVFHVVTHASFKALLFLAAGSVIHALHGEQDIRKMGGLKKELPATYAVFFIGTLAIAGIPPFAGFFSKDQMLSEMLHEKGFVVFGLAMVVSALTAFYMFRLLFLTFFGSARVQHQGVHEPAKIMTMPLILLSLLATVLGFIGIPHGIASSLGIHHMLDTFLNPIVTSAGTHYTPGFETMLALGTSIIILAAIYLSYRLFYAKTQSFSFVDQTTSAWKKTLTQVFFVDKVYDTLFTRPLKSAGFMLSRKVDDGGVDWMVEGFGKTARISGNWMRKTQTGNLGTYLLAMVIAVIFYLAVSLI